MSSVESRQWRLRLDGEWSEGVGRTYRVVPGDVTHFSAGHFTLARRRLGSVGCTWAFSCKTATCVIGAGHVQTSHVLGSLHIDLVMHDTFTCTLALALARRLHSGQQE